MFTTKLSLELYSFIKSLNIIHQFKIIQEGYLKLIIYAPGNFQVLKQFKQ